MKISKFIKLLILVFCFSSTLQVMANNHLVDQEIKGNFKTVIQTTFDGEEKFGEFKVSGIKSKVIFHYNDRGNIIEMCSFNSDGSLKDRSTNTYDNNDNVIEWNEYNSDSVLQAKEVYLSYDRNKNWTERKTYKSDGSLDRKVNRKFNQYGKISDMITYDSRGTYIRKTVYKYDNNKNCIESLLYNENGIMNTKYSYKYDINGRKIETSSYDKGLTLSYKSNSKYDVKGREIESIIKYFAPSGIVSYQYKYKYDNADNLIEDSEKDLSTGIITTNTYTEEYDKK